MTRSRKSGASASGTWRRNLLGGVGIALIIWGEAYVFVVYLTSGFGWAVAPGTSSIAAGGGFVLMSAFYDTIGGRTRRWGAERWYGTLPPDEPQSDTSPHAVAATGQWDPVGAPDAGGRVSASRRRR